MRGSETIALLTNFIPPYRLPLYEELSRRSADFQILLSTVTEPGRMWAKDWGQLSVRLQRTITVRGKWRHPHQFSEPLVIHFPYDTLPQLFRVRPDVVVSCEMGMRTLQSVMYRRLVSGSRLIVWATLSDVTEQGRGRGRGWLRRHLLRRADAVIVNGEGGARYIQRYGVERERIFFAPYTTNLDPFLALPVKRSPQLRHRLVYSGMLAERKGVIPFLVHLARWAVQHPGRQVELLLVGDGPLRPQISAFNAPRNLTLNLIGPVSYDQLPAIYGNSGILAFPTLADEWGLVVTEALASGVPVLGSRYSQAVEELVRDDENGWTFRPDHPSEVWSALQRALDSPTDRVNEMAGRSRAMVADLTPHAMADRIMSAVEFARRSTTPHPGWSHDATTRA
jgi:glycosyltransferase involved in cell wall biosynthesis